MQISYILAALVALLSLAACRGEVEDEKSALDPNAAAFLEQAQSAYAQGAYRASLALSDSAETYAPNHPEVEFNRALVYTALKKHGQAREALRGVLDRDPSFRGAWYNLGHSAFLDEQYREAIRHYERENELLASHDDKEARARVLLQIGRSYEQLGAADTALVMYERVLAMDSAIAEAHAWASGLYENSGRTVLALDHAKRALELDPQNFEYVYRVGTLLFNEGSVREAAPFLGEVARRWPGHEGAAYNYGRALVALGREDEGIKFLDRVDELQELQAEILKAQRGVDLHPQDAGRWINLASLMVRSGYLERAQEAYGVAAYLRPQDLSLQNDLANVSLARGDTAQALYRYQAVLARDSTFADAWLNLGVVYAEQGRFQRARYAWKRALDSDPQHTEAQTFLARLDEIERR